MLGLMLSGDRELPRSSKQIECSLGTKHSYSIHPKQESQSFSVVRLVSDISPGLQGGGTDPWGRGETSN